MDEMQIELPAMFGDHHVLAVRAILLEMAGVETVWASAAWRTVTVRYDPAKVTPAQIEARLAEEGYTQPAPVPVLNPEADAGPRYSSTLNETTKTMGFAQRIAPVADARPLWPCPGMAPWRETETQAESS